LTRRYVKNAIAVELPLSVSDTYGYSMLTDIRSVLKQNFKSLILTIPGERVMTPNYGVGLKTFLFENFGESVFSQIDSKIREQASIYIPSINVGEISFDGSREAENTLIMSVSYRIPTMGISDIILLPVNIGETF